MDNFKKSKKKITVLSLNFTDLYGGAARGVYRIHLALNDLGIDSKIGCLKKESNSKKIIDITTLYNWWDKSLILYIKIKNIFYQKILNVKKVYYLDCSEIDDSALMGTLKRINFDVLHLNWVTGGFVNFRDLQHIRKPIVVTLADCSMFTGICHVIDDCENYKTTCGNCPKINSKKNNDISQINHLLKKKYYKNLDMTFVSPSNWMKEKAGGSSLLKNKSILVIPYGIDTKVFSPIEKKEAKLKLGLNQNKKYLLFGSVSLKDERKGLNLLLQALKYLEHLKNIELITFGNLESDFSTNIPTRNLNYILNDKELALIYSASDLMIVPSKEESFGQTASESLACGTPVVAFAISGLLDIVDHKVNGYLASPFDTFDLSNGIIWCLDNNLDNTLSINGRKKVMNHFEIYSVSSKYKKLFKSLVTK